VSAAPKKDKSAKVKKEKVKNEKDNTNKAKKENDVLMVCEYNLNNSDKKKLIELSSANPKRSDQELAI
jgi:hypothetical protein